jgi:hypothetical protein
MSRKRKMAKAKKPIFGFILSLIGGIIILLFGALGFATLAGILGIVWGILVVIFALLLYMKGKIWGILVLIIGLINLIGTFVSFGADFYWIGSILSILGGLLGYLGY